MSLHNRPEHNTKEIVDALISHGLEHAGPSQLADAFRLGFQAAGQWIAFADQPPPIVAALDDPSVTVTESVLVTNNITALNRMGQLSHVWLAGPIFHNGEWMAFDDADRRILGLTHWMRLPRAARVPT